MVLALALLAAAFGASSAQAAAGSSLEQCANGPVSAPHACDFTAAESDPWVNGNLNATKAHYLEGDSVPYRMVFTDLSTTAGTNLYTTTIEWDTTESSGKHGIDYITSYNRTEATANACLDVAGCGGLPSTMSIPADPAIPAGISQGDAPGTPGKMTLFGGTITGITVPLRDVASYDDASKTSVVVSFTANVANPVLAWGGHISTRKDWGQNTSAISINGSPYHMRRTGFSGGGGGNQDRSLTSDAVIYPASLKVTKDAQPSSSQSFGFTTSGAGLSDFSSSTTASRPRRTRSS